MEKWTNPPSCISHLGCRDELDSVGMETKSEDVAQVTLCYVQAEICLLLPAQSVLRYNMLYGNIGSITNGMDV